MDLKAKLIDLDVGGFRVAIHRTDAEELGLHPQDRVRLDTGPKAVVAVVDVSRTFVPQGTIGLFHEVAGRLEVKDGQILKVHPAQRPASVEAIKRKMRGEALNEQDLRRLVSDIVEGSLTEIELASWVVASEIRGAGLDEIEHLTRCMVETGQVIDFGENVIYDKHSIGGVPGNKITLVVVPIVAAAGLLIPKTSSRAITGAAGTADVVEVFCNVHLGAEEIRRITLETGGVMAWGGAVNLAPADDIIIRVEHPMGLDPRPQLLSSVMAKKAAVQARNVVIDIPLGPGTKIKSHEEARALARDFTELGARLGMRVECAITYGGQPVGKAVGPKLEAAEALQALRNDGAPESLVRKSTAIAGILLEMGGVAPPRKGDEVAQQILRSGRAYEKFVEIVRAQGGPEPEMPEPGTSVHDVLATDDGYVSEVHNKAISALARALGSPKDKGAGVALHKKRGDRVEAGERLVTLYAEKKTKLEEAMKLFPTLPPVKVEGMLLERFPSYREV